MRVILLFLIACQGMLAQHQLLDSLHPALGKSSNDSVRAGILNELSVLHRKTSTFDSAVYYAQKALVLSRQITSIRMEARALNLLGNAYMMQGRWPESLQSYFSALRLMEKSMDRKGMATCYGNIGNIYYYQGSYEDALKNQFAALRLKEVLNDRKGMVFTYNNIANVYTNQSKYAEAEIYYLKAAAIMNEEVGDDGLVMNKAGMAVSRQGLGNLYYYQGNFDKALKEYDETLQLQERLHNRMGIANALINVGATYHKLGDPERGLQYCLRGKGVAEEVGSIEFLKEASEALSDIYAERGAKSGKKKYYQLALSYYQDYIKYKDSLLSEENTKKSVRLEMKYQFEKKEEASRQEQQKKDAVAAAELRRQRIMLLSISGLGLFVLAFAIFAYRSFLQKKKANLEILQQKELIEQKQKETLDSIYYARRIQRALLPQEKYLRRVLSKRGA